MGCKEGNGGTRRDVHDGREGERERRERVAGSSGRERERRLCPGHTHRCRSRLFYRAPRSGTARVEGREEGSGIFEERTTGRERERRGGAEGRGRENETGRGGDRGRAKGGRESVYVCVCVWRNSGPMGKMRRARTVRKEPVRNALCHSGHSRLPT